MNQVFTEKVEKNKRIKIFKVIFITLLFVFVHNKGAFAHASLVQASPAANSQQKTAPTKVELIFNERMEKELYSIRVLNQQGQKITDNPAQMSEDQTKISLDLPPLIDGIYTVTYHIMSSDGHPVQQSYVFSVGVVKEIADSVGFPKDDHQQGGWIFLFIRILYYLSLLFLTGWLFWGIFFSFVETEISREYQFWLPFLKHFYLLMVVLMGFGQFSLLLSEAAMNEWLSVLFGTTFGLTWIVSVFLSLLGYFTLRRRKWIDMLWIIVLLGVEGINGHAVSFQPAFLTVLLDILHLVTASVWVGGLLILALLWRNYHEQMISFLPIFSKLAFYSIITLVITGVGCTFFFLPKWNYLMVTEWGYLLVAKTALVILVLAIAGVIRHKMKNQVAKLGAWLKYDFTLMLFIVGVVGVLTYKSPLPTNQPLNWHQMGRGTMVTAQITPNSPGNNQFNVEVNLSKMDTTLKHIDLFLKNSDKGLAPISIPLQPQSNEGKQGEFGLAVYKYTSEGPYLPFAGDWTFEIRILDSNDDEAVFTKDFTVY